MDKVDIRSEVRSFGGTLQFCSHYSVQCVSDMRFAIYLPPQAQDQPVPTLYWLSGLTCTEENFMVKAGAQRWAAELGVALVAPDTSPRNTGIEGEEDDWDLGSGAGFYVNATQGAWNTHYRMYDYIVEELPYLLESQFPLIPAQKSIFGHSMGGHGALVMALRNPDRYRSVSAFAPICAPCQCPWGEKAFSHYLGDDRSVWADYDAIELLKTHGVEGAILVDQGEDDVFLSEQLNPELLKTACAQTGQKLTLRYHAGYDHSYYFIASFIEDHMRFHAERLLSN